MAHFTNSVHRHSSFGRTRQAKNLAGKHETAITPAGAGVNPSAATDGYPTETQKHLHLMLSETQDDADNVVTVWAYSHAFGVWHILKASGTNVTITARNGTTVKTGADAIDISGVDRVYFQLTAGAMHANDRFYAAANTMPVK